MVDVATDLVAIEETDDVVTIELSRPDKLNALNPAMIEGLATAFEQLHEDPGQGVLLDGAGRVTCAGMDRDIVSDDYEAKYGDLNARLGDLYELTTTYPRPVAMAGRGAVIGAAAILSVCCEFLVLDEEATYAVPEVSYGIASERIATTFTDVAGWRVGAELALTGEPIDPERAHAAGLANDVVPEPEVRARARELLATVGEHDDETVARVVENLVDARARLP